MTRAEVTADLIASHDDFRSALAEAATAAVQLVVNPRNPDAAQQCTVGRKFLAMTRAHMAHEEATVFPEAIATGVAARAIAKLYADHERLRALALSLEPRLHVGSVGDAEALALLRFVHRFEQHVHREEWTLARHHGC